MEKYPKCFISYAHRDKQFLEDEILPILKELRISLWLDYEQVRPSDLIFDSLISNIQNSDFIIVIQGQHSDWVSFELGAVLTQNKPVLIIATEEINSPTRFLQFHHLIYNSTAKQDFRNQLKKYIIGINENLIDKRLYNLVENVKIIGVRVGLEYMDYEQELRFTADFIKTIKIISNTSNIKLVYTDKGSLKSFFSIDIKAFAELIEKIIFFIPEWQKRKAEVFKVKAETAKIESETSLNESDIRIKEAMAMADLFEKYKKLGLKFQLDSEMTLSLNQRGELEITRPIELKE